MLWEHGQNFSKQVNLGLIFCLCCKWEQHRKGSQITEIGSIPGKYIFLLFMNPREQTNPLESKI